MLVPQAGGGELGVTPYGWVLLLKPYLTDRYCAALTLVVSLTVTRFSRYGVEKMPSWAGKSPFVVTDWNVSWAVRSTAAKKCALSFTIGPPKLPPN